MRTALLTLTLLFSASASLAEPFEFKLVDTGWLEDTTRGSGVYMIFQTANAPAGGLSSLDEVSRNACNEFEATVVPFVLGKTGRSEPAFIAVTIRVGTATFGTYRRTFYKYENGACEESF